MEIKNRNISVIGAIRSGVGAAKLIKKLGGNPFVSDSGKSENLIISILKSENIQIKYIIVT